MTRSGHGIAVVIPALEEAHTIANAVASAEGADRIVVADGGSTDGTAYIARSAGAHVVSAPRGRARQLNAGARAAGDASVLLFLHADSVLPAGWAVDVREVLSRPDCVAGAFGFSVMGDRLSHRVISAVGDARSRIARHPYGDQGLFLAADTFARIGGYPDQPLMEDWEIVRRLRRHGRIGIARSRLRTSSRQWDDGGMLRSTAIYMAVIGGYRLGVPHERLSRLWDLGLDPKRAPRV